MFFFLRFLFCTFCFTPMTQAARQTTPEKRAKSPELLAACYGADDLLENSFPALTSNINNLEFNHIIPLNRTNRKTEEAKLQKLEDNISVYKSSMYKTSNQAGSDEVWAEGYRELDWMMASPANLIETKHGIDILCDYLYKKKHKNLMQKDRYTGRWTGRYYVRDYYTEEDLATALKLKKDIDDTVSQIKALTTRNFHRELYNSRLYCRRYPAARGCPADPGLSTILRPLQVISHPDKYNQALAAKQQGQKLMEQAQHLARFANYHWNRVNGISRRMSYDNKGIGTRLEELYLKTRRIRPKGKHFRRLRSKLRFGLKYLKRMTRHLRNMTTDLADERLMVRDAERYIEDIRVAVNSLKYQWVFVPRNTPHILYRTRAIEMGHPARRQANHTFMMAKEKLEIRLAESVRPVRESLAPIQQEVPKIQEHRPVALEYSNISSYINTARAGLWYNKQNLQSTAMYLCNARQRGLFDRITSTQETPISQTEPPDSTSSSESSSGDVEEEDDLIFIKDGATEPTRPPCSSQTPVSSTVRAVNLDCADSAMYSQDMLMDIKKGYIRTQGFRPRLAFARESMWQTRRIMSKVIIPQISISRMPRDISTPGLVTRMGFTKGRLGVTHEKLGMWLRPAIKKKKKSLKNLVDLLKEVNSGLNGKGPDGYVNVSEPVAMTSSLEALHVRLMSLRQQTDFAMEQIRLQTKRVVALANHIQPVEQLSEVPKTRLILPAVINTPGLVKSFGLSLRTKLSHGNIITLSEPGAGLRNDSYSLRLYIEKGIPHLEWDDFRSKNVTQTKKRIDDDGWHHLQVTRTGQLLQLVEVPLKRPEISTMGKITLAPSGSMAAFPSHMELLTPLKKITKAKKKKVPTATLR